MAMSFSDLSISHFKFSRKRREDRCSGFGRQLSEVYHSMDAALGHE
jgi:hypothetical protein